MKDAAREAAAKTLATQAGPTELAVFSAPKPLPEDVPISLIIYNVAGLYLYRLVAGTELRVGKTRPHPVAHRNEAGIFSGGEQARKLTLMG
ncbi:MAG: hypothetical protein OXG13_00915 [Gemmatimonadaceae bacterium]|nr:hypothetical protein [Gemmatimonadaceae bacterium]